MNDTASIRKGTKYCTGTKYCKDTIVKEYQQGSSIYDILHTYPVERTYVCQVLYDAGIELREEPRQTRMKSSEYIHIENDYNAGMSAPALSKKYACSVTNIYQILREGRVTYRRKLDKEDAIAMYQNGASITEIAKKYNVLLSTVYHLLERSGVKQDGRRYHPKTAIHKTMTEEYTNGMTIQELTQKYHYTYYYLRNLLKEKGVVLRPEKREAETLPERSMVCV